jgi:SAM-dependent methyltransferase
MFSVASSDPTRAFYDEYADAYEAKTKDLQPKAAIEAFMKLLPSKGCVLDVGCAFGRDSKTFVEHGLSVEGVDFSSTLIQRARALVPQGTFHVQDVRDLRFPAALFDGIWACAVLLHLPKSDIPAVLRSLHDLLREGGVLFVGLQCGEGGGIRNDERYDNAAKWYSYFSIPEVEEYLAKAGFVVADSEQGSSNYNNRPFMNVLARKA